MPTAIEKRLNAIERMLKELSGRIEQRPVVQTVKSNPQTYLLIDKGNVLTSGQDGIKNLTTTITSVPSAYDPNVTSSFIDGIGRARLVSNAVIQDGYVLVCNDQRSMWRCAFVKDDAVATSGTVSISYGAGSVTAYVPV